VTRPAEIEIPDSWRRLGVENWGGGALVVGDVDSGKTTLAAWIAATAAAAGRRVGVLDADVGQSRLGLPGTMNLAIVDAASIDPTLHRRWFVGATSPRGHMLPLVVGLGRLAGAAAAAGVDLLVVDTGGLVAPRAGGVALQHWSMELLQPREVVAICRGGELAPLLAPLVADARRRLHRLPPAAAVRRRSAAERAARREQAWERYLAGSEEMSVGTLPVYDADRATPGTVAAWIDPEGFTSGLGVITGRDASGRPLLHAPPGAARGAVALRIGTMDVHL
jgi:polynucleotide 5'-hydroxyl-kinase GRC3/NOL9